MSVTADEVGNVEGSCSSVRSPLDLEITRTRPDKNFQQGLEQGSKLEPTSRHSVRNPVRSADSRSGQEDRILLNQSNGRGLDSVTRSLNIIQR
jgi:hypothetical protein